MSKQRIRKFVIREHPEEGEYFHRAFVGTTSIGAVSEVRLSWDRSALVIRT
jgi:hypothetical protein